MAITPFLRLQKPPFDTAPWDEAINGDMDIIDAFIAQYMSVPNYMGVWANSVVYTSGQNALDTSNSIIYMCQVSHTSAASPTTFAQDRATHPTYWTRTANVPSDWAAQAAASAAAAAASATQAGNSATAAAGSASAASGSATAASGSATAAAGSASAASTSAANAANSATAAQNWYQLFTSTYYGPYASPPTVDPNGGARTLGDLYFNTSINQMQEWTATGWQPLASVGGSGGGSRVTVSDTAPIGAVAGDLWFDSVGIQMYVSYFDGNSQQWVIANNPVVALNTASKADVAAAQNNVGRNLIHNSMFNIAQRGAGPWTAAGYTADRWGLTVGADTVSWSVVAMTDTDRTQIGDEAVRSNLQNVFTGNAAVGAVNYGWQKIEDVRRLANKTVTVSFWAKAATGTPKLGMSVDQNFGTGGSPSAEVDGNGVAVTLNTIWTRFTQTIVVPSIAGKALGTNSNDCTQLNFWYSAGTNWATRAGNIGVQSGTIGLWGVQLEVAAPGQTQPTPLEKPDLELQLRQCQRFYQTGNMWTSGWVGAGSIGITALSNLPVTMRGTPTVTTNVTSSVNVSGTAVTSYGPGAVIIQASSSASGGFIAQAAYTVSADL